MDKLAKCVEDSVAMISDGKRVNDGVEINGKWMHIENDIDGNMSSNYSGWSVGMSSDDTVITGAPRNDVANRSNVSYYKQVLCCLHFLLMKQSCIYCISNIQYRVSVCALY